MVATALPNTTEVANNNMDVQPDNQTGEPVILTVTATGVAGEAVQIPGGAWFLRADFSREGADLVLTGPEGQHVIIEGYFEASEPPALTTGNGVTLKGHVVVNLAGPLAPGQYVADGPDLAQLGEPIGTIETLDGTVEVTRVDGTIETLNPGDPIYQGDFVETASDGSFGVVFMDESTFSLGSDGRITFDEMVYSADDQSGSATMTLLQGTFSFVSGAIAKTDPDAMVIDTPTATIGIRGTGGGGSANANGELTIAILPESGDITGEIVVANDQGNTIINQPNTGVNVTPGASPTIPIPFSGQQLGQVFGTTLLTLPNDVAAFTPETLSDVRAGIQGAAQARAAASEATEAVTQAQAAVAAAEAAVAAATTEAGIAAARLAVAEAQAEVAVAEAIKAEAQLAVVETSGEGAVALAASAVGVATSGAAALKAATQQAATAATAAEAAIDALGSGQTPGEAGPDTIDSGESGSDEAGAPAFTTVEVPVPVADDVLEPVLASLTAPVPELEPDTVPDADDTAEVIALADTPEEILLPPEERVNAAYERINSDSLDALIREAEAADTATFGEATGNIAAWSEAARSIFNREEVQNYLIEDSIEEEINNATSTLDNAHNNFSTLDPEMAARDAEASASVLLRQATKFAQDAINLYFFYARGDTERQLMEIEGFYRDAETTLDRIATKTSLRPQDLVSELSNINDAITSMREALAGTRSASTVAEAEVALEGNSNSAGVHWSTSAQSSKNTIDAAARAAGVTPADTSADALPSDLVPPVSEEEFEQSLVPLNDSEGGGEGPLEESTLEESTLEEGSLSVVRGDGTEETIDLAGTTGNTVALEGTAGDDQFGLVVRVEEEGLPFSDNHIALSGGAGDDIFDVSITGVEDGGNNRLVLDGGAGADTFSLDMDNLENAVTFRYDSVLDAGDTIMGLTTGDDFHMAFDPENFEEATGTNFQAGGTNDESGLEQTVLWFYNADTATLQYDADGFNNGNEAETIATFRNADGEVHNVDLTADQLTFNEDADTGMG